MWEFKAEFQISLQNISLRKTLPALLRVGFLKIGLYLVFYSQFFPSKKLWSLNHCHCKDQNSFLKVHQLCLKNLHLFKGMFLNSMSIHKYYRNHQQNIKVLWKRSSEAKRIYELKCREEIGSNQFYHQEVARCGKSSKEAEKVSVFFS